MCFGVRGDVSGRCQWADLCLTKCEASCERALSTWTLLELLLDQGANRVLLNRLFLDNRNCKFEITWKIAKFFVLLIVFKGGLPGEREWSRPGGEHQRLRSHPCLACRPPPRLDSVGRGGLMPGSAWRKLRRSMCVCCHRDLARSGNWRALHSTMKWIMQNMLM